MTKRRSPTPLKDRRKRSGAGRRPPRRPEIPQPPSGPVDYFDERLALFLHACERAAELTKIVAGQHVDERKGWAQWNHLRMCIVASSIITLADYQPRIDAGEECTLDQGSIAALARGMAEAAAMVAYLTDPALTPEQWELRKHVLWLHDATTRYKMFSKLEKDEQATAFRADMQDLRTRIEAFPEFQALAPERQGKVIAGSEIYLHGLRSAVRLLGLRVRLTTIGGQVFGSSTHPWRYRSWLRRRPSWLRSHARDGGDVSSSRMFSRPPSAVARRRMQLRFA